MRVAHPKGRRGKIIVFHLLGGFGGPSRVHAHPLGAVAHLDAIFLDRQLVHQHQDGLVPVKGRLAVSIDVINRGRLHQPRQEGRLAQVQVLGRGMKIHLRRGLHPVRQVAVVDFVEIHLQDIILGVLAGDLGSQHDLAGFPLVTDLRRFFRAQQQHSRQLLGDGGSSRNHLAGGVILPEGARDAHGIKTRVVIELLVLGSNDRGHHVRRDAIQGHVGAPPGVGVQDFI